MKKIYKCGYCEREFDGYDSEESCLNHEIECSGEKENTFNYINKAKEILENQYGVKFLEVDFGISAESSNFGCDYSTWKYFNGTANYKNMQFDFYINNDSVGDGREEATLDSVENIIEEFKHKYINRKEIDSSEICGQVKLSEEDLSSDQHKYYWRNYVIGNHNAEELIDSLVGKTIKIEVLN